MREQGCWVCTGPEVQLGMWLVYECALLWVGNGPLAGEPFRLTGGSPVPIAAPAEVHKQHNKKDTAASSVVNIVSTQKKFVYS